MDVSSSIRPPSASSKWCPAWSDEFDSQKIDPAKWRVLGDSRRGGGMWLKRNVSLDGRGHLVIMSSPAKGKTTTGGIDTYGKFQQKYGLFVIRAELPTRPGHRVGFWLQSKNSAIHSDGRKGTEIDILEQYSRSNIVTHNLHWNGYGKYEKSWNYRFQMDSIQGWHTYALRWTPDNYQFYVDGALTAKTKAGGVSRVPEFIRITDEPMEGMVAQKDKFLVDYVRVYSAC